MVFSQDGIFSREEQATDKYGQAKARETLELLFTDIQMSRYEEGLSGEDYENRLDNKIKEIGELIPKEDESSNNQQVILDGYIFLIDRSVPKIIEELGKANDIIITARVSNNDSDGWVSAEESTANITGTIKTYSGGKITEINAKVGSTTIPFSIDVDGKYTIDNITDSGIYTISAKDSKGKNKSKEINVTVKVDKTAPTVEKITATREGNKLKLSATGHDKDVNGEEQSGIKEFIYTITPADGTTPASGTFNKNAAAEITINRWEIYTIKVTATDKCGNTTATPKEQIADLRDTTPPVISNATATTNLMKITIKADVSDPESGITSFTYNVTGQGTVTPAATGDLESSVALELTTGTPGSYTVTFTAANGAGTTTTVTKTVTTTDMLSVAEAKKLVNSMSALQKYMGIKVNYKSGETWQIFYYDQAGEFGTANTLYLKKAWTANDTTLTLSQKTSNTDPAVIMMRKMNPLWARSTAHNVVDLDNEKASVWLCDTSVWDSKRNSTYSSYAIGSPSVEMYMKAWNVYKTGYKDSKDTNSENIVCKLDDSNRARGYMVGSKGTYTSSGTNTDNFDDLRTK